MKFRDFTGYRASLSAKGAVCKCCSFAFLESRMSLRVRHRAALLEQNGESHENLTNARYLMGDSLVIILSIIIRHLHIHYLLIGRVLLE